MDRREYGEIIRLAGAEPVATPQEFADLGRRGVEVGGRIHQELCVHHIVNLQHPPQECRDRDDDLVVPIASVRVHADGLEDADHAEGDGPDADLCADRVAVEEVARRGLPHQRDPRRGGDILAGEVGAARDGPVPNDLGGFGMADDRDRGAAPAMDHLPLRCHERVGEPHRRHLALDRLDVLERQRGGVAAAGATDNPSAA